ncbi:MAG: glycosyltransferase [Clostridia bacterium]|nr:glycosyltransferase [Clostridia bacterium]
MKLLFVCYGLGIGGIEKCLLNLINSLPEDNYSVDCLLMNSQYSILKSQIKRKVNFLDDFKYVMNTENTFNDIQNHGGVFRNFTKFISYCIYRLCVKLGISPWKTFKPLPGKYDVAIAYSHHDYSPRYVIDKVTADRKVLWYHNGAYEKTGKEYNRDKNYFSKFNYVVAVSSDCAKVLESKFSFSNNKLIILRNICDVENILIKSKEFTPAGFDDTAIDIVTVGRLTSEKGADLAVRACSKLCSKGYKLRWHWIGDGNQTSRIRQMIEEFEVQDCFFLEGNQNNPYPFINCCDIYVQTSYYEAYSTTITEAKVLCKPIVTTDVGGMRDQIENGVNGLIVDIDADEIANAVSSLLDNMEKKNSFISELENGRKYFANSLEEYERTVFS